MDEWMDDTTFESGGKSNFSYFQKQEGEHIDDWA